MRVESTPRIAKEFSWPRIVVCGLATGGVWTLLSVALLALVGEDFLAALRDGHTSAKGDGPQMFLTFANLATGIWAIWLYAVVRPRFGPGPGSALRAGVAWWMLASLQSAKWAALLTIPPAVAWAPLAGSLVAGVVATLVGAWFYEK